MKRRKKWGMISVLSILLMMLCSINVFAATSTEIVYGEGGTITRAEWLHDLAVIFEMTVEDEIYPDNYFSDLSDESEYYQDILLNVQFGVIDVELGMPIYPDEPVSREFAAHTLNYCLGYQLDEGAEYTYSDAEECTYQEDIQISLNRGWFLLIDGDFSPETSITTEEVTVMLEDAQTTIQECAIDTEHTNEYEVVEEVVEVPIGTVVNKIDDTTLQILDCPVTINEGDTFVVFYDELASAYVASTVSVSENITTITVETVEDEEIFANIDAEGTIAADITQIEPLGDTEIVFVDDSTGATYSDARIASRAIKAWNTTVKAATEIEIASGVKAKVTAKIKNPQIEYKITGTEAYACLEADVEVSASLKGNIAGAIDKSEIELINWPVAGIGNFVVAFEYDFGGEVSSVFKTKVKTGISYNYSKGFRTIANFNAKGISSEAKVTAKDGVVIKLGITEMPVIKAYVYGRTGIDISGKETHYVDGNLPECCRNFSAHWYASYGAEASVKLSGVTKKKFSVDTPVYNEKNSPMRVARHYEDGVEVAKCTRDDDADNGYFTTGTSNYSGIGWSGANNSTGLDSDGNPIVLYTYTVDDDGNATITGYTGNASVLVIPETIDGYTVTTIGGSAFNGNEKLQTVIIPESVIAINEMAFANCGNLSTVELPNSVEKITAWAFYNCDSLESIVIPSGLTEVPSAFISLYWRDGSVFEGCDNLKTVYFAEGITCIPMLMNGCTALEKVVLPETVTEISAFAFASCTNLKEIEIPESVTYIGGAAFSTCSSLSDISLPTNLSKIGAWAFYNCDSIECIEIPANISEVENTFISSYWRYGGVFAECDNLKIVSFEEGITKLKLIFNDCTSIEKIVLPDTVTEIEDSAFSGCSGLVSIEIPESVIVIGGNAFNGCTQLSDLKLPSKLSKIGAWAFYNCDSLKSINIPASITEIPSVFVGSYWRDGALFEACDNLETIYFEDGVSKIYLMFNNCTSIETIEIPNTVSQIAGAAFSGCSQLQSICIPDSVTQIGESIFYNCTNLNSVVLSENCTSIKANMFYNCDALETIEIPDSVTIIEAKAFESSGLRSINISDKIKTMGDGVFKDCSSLQEIEVENGVTSLGNNVFYNCDALMTVALPSSVITLGNSVFYDCDILRSIILPDSITSVGSSLFYDCDALTSVQLGKGITSIPTSCFEHCDVLESLVLPYRVASIGANAFKDCVKFTSITIPRATTSIESTAFSYPAILTIYGVAGTYAETFAAENGINFVSNEVNATGVTLDKTEITVKNGSTEQLTLTVEPEDFTDAVSWKSTDASVATIDDSGLVTATGVGTATIKVVVGDVNASCKVTVVQPVTSISLNKTSVTMEALATYQLTATVKPDNAADRTITWSSSDPEVAAVDDSGLVTALKKGTATITAAAQDGSGVTKTCTVTVSNTAYIVSTVDEMQSSHNYTSSCSDVWVYTLEQAEGLNVTFDEQTEMEDGFDYIYIYDVNDTEIGKYTGSELAGKTISLEGDTVKIKLVSDASGNAYGFKVNSITAQGMRKADQVISGTVSYEKMITDDDFALDAVLSVGDGSLTYQSLNESVVSVSEDAMVTINGSGETEIVIKASETEQYNEAELRIAICIKKAEQAEFAIIEVASKTYGESDFVLTVTGGSGDGEVTYTVPEGNGVLTVEGNTATILGAGTVTITAVKSGGAEYEDAVAYTEITVEPKNISEDMAEEITGNYVYTGGAILPEVIVKDGSYVLVKNTDYIVDGSNNVNVAGADDDNAPQVIITGTGNYCGSVVRKFTIEKATVSGITVSRTYIYTLGSAGSTEIVNVAECLPADRGSTSYSCTVNDAELILQNVKVDESGKLTFAVSSGKQGGSAEIQITAVTGNYQDILVKVQVNLIACSHSDTSQYEVKGSAKAACAVAGYSGDTYCKICSQLVKSGETINAVGHSWDAGKITKAATATEDGEKTYTCTTCKETKTEAIKATGVAAPVVKPVTDPGTVVKDSATSGRFVVNSDGATVTYSKPTKTSLKTVSIPTTVKVNGTACKVTAIAANAFKNNKNLTKVTIGFNITSIGSNAFSGCKKLTTVSGGKNVTVIGSGAFNNCPKLKSVSVGSKVTLIDKKAFYKCTSLKKIALPTSVQTIGASAFAGCKALTTVSGAKGVTTIGGNAFSSCPKLKSISIGKKVTSIGTGAFSNCTSLTKVTLPSGLQKVGANTFKGCKKLTTVSGGKGIVTIGSSAFSNCTKLKSISIGGKVEVIGTSAFSKCTSLTKITLPANLKQIGKQTFAGCKNLKTIVIKTQSLTSKTVGANAFKGIHKKPTVSVPKNVAGVYIKLLKAKGVSTKAIFKKF